MDAQRFDYSAVDLWSAVAGHDADQRQILDALIAGVHHAAQRAAQAHADVDAQAVADIVFERLGLTPELRTNPREFFESGLATRLLNMHDEADAARVRGLLNELARAATSQLGHKRTVDRSRWKAFFSLFVLRR